MTVCSIFFCGFLIGVSLLGVLADRIGRKCIFHISLLIMCTTSLCSAFAPNVYIYAACRFLIGVGVAGVGTSSYILTSELIPSSYRHILTAIKGSCFALGGVFSAAIALLSYDWRTMTAAVALPSIPLLLLWKASINIESPRWYKMRGMYHAAGEIYELIRAVNHFDTTKVSPQQQIDSDGHTQFESLVDVATKPPFCWWLLGTAFMWFTASLAYYGLSFFAPSNPMPEHGLMLETMADPGLQNVAITTMTSYLCEVIALVLAGYLIGMERFGRRGVMLTGFSMASILSLAWLYSTGKIQTLLVIARLFIAASFTNLYLYGTEMFPTSVRSSCTGIASMSARLAGICAPFIFQNVQGSRSIIVMSGLCSVSALIAYFLPETLNKKLCNTLQEETDALNQTSIN